MTFTITPSFRDSQTALLEKLEACEKLLEEREFILSQTQKLAKTGSWSFDRKTQHTTWSAEMYNIHGLDNNFDTDDHTSVLNLYDESSRSLIIDAATAMYATQKPFAIVARIVTPLGYKKWVRVVAHPILNDGDVSGILGITSDITNAKEAEETLKESEVKFSTAFKRSPDLMAITREYDIRIMDLNDKVFKVLGYAREELIGRLSSDFKFYVNDKDRERFFKDYKAKGIAEIECPWIKKDGTIVHVLISSSRIQIKGEYYFISVIKDISARKLAEEKFRKVFELSPDVMMLVRLSDLKIIEVNNRIAEVSGYNREEVIGKLTTDISLWTDEEDKQGFLKQLETGKSCSITLMKKKDGQKFYGSITASLMELNGQAHFICSIRDISEYKEAQNKMEQNELKLNAIINNTDMDIWSVDTDLRVIALNDNFRNNVKSLYDVNLSVNTQITTIFRGKLHEDKFTMWLNLYQLALTGASVSLNDKRNDQTLNYSLHPIRKDNNIVGVVGYAKNVTEILKKEEELRAADKHIVELQLASLRAFMNPHFIFNALNSIQYFISSNDRTKAIHYLSTFSSLIRRVLVDAQSNCISLSDELEMLHHYVDIERLRFNNEFELKVEIDQAVVLSAIKIPSLLIQPFVENSIVHGFSKRRKNGIISVKIHKIEPNLVIDIEDNGIGRMAAQKVRASGYLKHESYGVSITSERLRLINKNNNISIKYNDLLESGKSSGTKVTITVAIDLPCHN